MAEEVEGAICDEGPGKEACCLEYAVEVANQCMETYEHEICQLGGNYERRDDFCAVLASQRSMFEAENYCFFQGYDDYFQYQYCVSRKAHEYYPDFFSDCIESYFFCLAFQPMYCQQSGGMAQNYCMTH